MPTYHVHLATPIRRTFRTEQVAGLFDLPLDDLAGERLAHTLTAELPGLDEDWTIGAIVGPSGSGKTTLARAAYGDAVYELRPWPEDAAIIDALESAYKAPTSGRGIEPVDVPLRVFGAGLPTSPNGPTAGLPVSCGAGDLRSMPGRGQETRAQHSRSCSPNTLTNGQGFDSAPIPLKTLLRTLAAVGLASPPSWLRPYRTLSTGERFRADLARALLASQINLTQRHRGAEEKKSAGNTLRASVTPCETLPLLVFDEFTSTLDRTVACTASHALGKYLRSATSNPKSEIPNPKFVCLSCHTDFLPWLAPDWILDLESSSLTPSGSSEREDVARHSASTGVEHATATRLPHGVRELRSSLTPSGSSAREDVARHSTSTEKERATAAQLPHGVRELLRPTWPRGSLQRPELRLRVRRVPQRLWPRFARHHYLSGGLSSAATCYAAFADNKALTSGQGDGQFDTDAGELPDGASDFAPNTPTTGRGFERPIAFCAVVATLGWKRTKRITRLVVLPEFQGLGIGPRLAETVAAAEAAKGNRVTITASHPSVLAWCWGSPRWRYLGLKKTGSTRQQFGQRTIRCSIGRAVASFEFVREGKAPAEP